MKLKRSKLIAALIGILFAGLTVLVWNSSISGGVAVFMAPGLYVGIMLSGKSISPSLWVVALVNFIFYFGIADLATVIWNRQRSKAK